MTHEADRIIREEGFSAVPYPDPIHGWEKPTFGHGLTYITPAESQEIVVGRVGELRGKLSRLLDEHHPGTDALDDDEFCELVSVLAHMAYQLGFSGCMSFRNMWASISRCDFAAAADEMLDSKWHDQTPARCERLAARMRALSHG